MLPSAAFIFIKPTLYHISECKENKDLRQLVAEVLKNEIIYKKYLSYLISVLTFQVNKDYFVHETQNKDYTIFYILLLPNHLRTYNNRLMFS